MCIFVAEVIASRYHMERTLRTERREEKKEKKKKSLMTCLFARDDSKQNVFLSSSVLYCAHSSVCYPNRYNQRWFVRKACFIFLSFFFSFIQYGVNFFLFCFRRDFNYLCLVSLTSGHSRKSSISFNNLLRKWPIEYIEYTHTYTTIHPASHTCRVTIFD